MTDPGTPDEHAAQDLAVLREALFGPVDLPEPARQAMYARTFDPQTPEPGDDLLPGWTGADGPFGSFDVPADDHVGGHHAEPDLPEDHEDDDVDYPDDAPDDPADHDPGWLQHEHHDLAQHDNGHHPEPPVHGFGEPGVEHPWD
jgi:hypothetical protein